MTLVYSFSPKSTGKARSRAFKLSLCLALCFLFSFAGGLQPIPANAAQPSSIGLSLASKPSVLPADGGSYPSLVLQFKNTTSGIPIIPQKDVSIFLTSSNPQAGTVQSEVTFPQGTSFMTVNFQTTSSPGTTTVSAIASGYPSASLQVKTVVTGGMPASLVVFASPSVILPDKNVKAHAVVQVVDLFGLPVKLGQSLTVSLSSSNSQIGSVNGTVKIPQGSSYAVTSFFPTYIAGQTIVGATAGNLTSGSATFSTVGPIPRRLVLSVAPGIIPSNTSETSIISVQLQDNVSETPAIAPYDVSVVLTSNNNSIAALPNPPIITIKAGTSYATIPIQSSSAGTANITASAQGYIKGSITVTAAGAVRVSSTQNTQLSMAFAPTTLLPNNQSYSGAIVAELMATVGGTLYPAYLSTSTQIYARSSNNATMQVSTGSKDISATLPPGRTHLAFNIQTTFLPGTVSITAQSIGITPVTQALISFGGAPNSLAIQFTPSILTSDGNSYNSVVVSLIDSASGAPAKAPVSTIVNLASTDSSVGTIQNSIIIPAGQTFFNATFHTSGLPGTTLITASASNYTSANATLTLTSQGATQLALYAVPSTILANGQQSSNLVVQLQNSGGSPEKTDTPVPIELLAQNSTLATVSPMVTILPGATYASVSLNSTVPGTINVTAFASGFLASHVLLTSYLIPLTAQVHVSSATVLPRGALNLSIVVISGGTPLQNASITWSADYGILQNMVNQTNVNGTATASYLAGVRPGAFLIHAMVSKIGYLTLNVTASIRIINTTASTVTNSNDGFFSMEFLSVPLWIFVTVGSVGGAGATAFLVIRRRGLGGAPEYVEDE